MDVRTTPTWYKGVKYRSATEARWAFVFDQLKLEFQYEPEGFQLPTRWYLPDFWFPTLQLFGEVKGAFHHWDDEARTKAQELVMHTGRGILLFTDLSPLEDQIPVLICEQADGTTEITRYRVDIPGSAAAGRPWFECDSPLQAYYRADAVWSDLVKRARAMRFYEPTAA